MVKSTFRFFIFEYIFFSYCEFFIFSFFYKYLRSAYLINGATYLSIKMFTNLDEFAVLLRKSKFFLYESLVDITAIDYVSFQKKFDLVYNFLSMFYNKRLFLNFFVFFKKSHYFSIGVRSLLTCYPSANWLEREVWDMFGIWFIGHSDLRRILTDYGFKGFPLRKDFPLSGFFEYWYDDIKKMIVVNDLHFLQEFRVFNFSNIWSNKNFFNVV